MIDKEILKQIDRRLQQVGNGALVHLCNVARFSLMDGNRIGKEKIAWQEYLLPFIIDALDHKNDYKKWNILQEKIKDSNG